MLTLNLILCILYSILLAVILTFGIIIPFRSIMKNGFMDKETNNNTLKDKSL